jgi:hypothetical protein
MTPPPAPPPNPRRVAAGRRNRAKSQGVTPEGRERLRQAALLNRPWLHSTGPRTPEGKAKVAMNGKARQQGPRSVRQTKADLGELRGLLREMKETRRVLTGAGLEGP